MKKAGVFVFINIMLILTATGVWAADYNPAAAYDPVNDQYLVVYEQFSDTDETYRVTGQRVDSSGVAIGNPFDINTTASTYSPSPSVVYHAADGQFLVVWQQDYSAIYGRFVTPLGGFGTEATIINDETAYPEYSPSVAYNSANGQSLVVWPSVDIAAGQYIMVGKRITLDTGSLSLVDETNVHIADNADGINFLFPCITYDTNNNRYLIAWSRQDLSTANLGIGAAFVTADLQATSITSIPAGDNAMFPAVAYDSSNDNFLLVWMEQSTDYDIIATTIQSDGSALAPITISAASGNELFPAVAFDAGHGGFIVAWDDLRSASTWDIYGQWVTDGGLENSAFEVAASTTGDQQSAAMAYNTTSGSMLTAYSSDSTGDFAIEYTITGVDQPDNPDYSPAVAYDPVNDLYLMVYEQFTSNNESYRLIGQRVNSRGATIGTSFYINPTETNSSLSPSVVFDATAGQFLVVWIQDYSSIYGRFVSSDGTFGTDATLIINAPSSTLYDPVASYNPASGQSLVVGETYDYLSYVDTLVGRRVELSSGEVSLPDSAGITIATDSEYALTSPCIAVDTINNSYLVVWSRTIESSSDGLGIALVGSDGQVLSQTNPANLTGGYSVPAVAFDSANGNFLLVWRDDTNPSDINIGGAAISTEGSVDTPFSLSTAVGNQGAPAVVFNSVRGSCMVAWQDDRSSYFDIYGQWITNGSIDGSEFEIIVDTGNQYEPAMAYNTVCGTMMTVYTSSITGLNNDNQIQYAFTGDFCALGTEAIIPAGATVADYRMVTFPVTAQPDLRIQIAEQLGEPDSTQWRLLRWDPATEAYLEVTDEAWGEDQACIPGRAYWAISRPGTTLTIYGTPSPGTGSVQVVLKPGWNQIGSPFDFSVQWNSDITVSNGSLDESVGTSTMIGNSLWQYDNESGYIEASVLVQGRGYWVYNATIGDLTMTVPANRYIGSIWNDLRQMVARWFEGIPRSAVAAGSTPPPPPGALDADPDSKTGGCFITTTTFFNAD